MNPMINNILKSGILAGALGCMAASVFTSCSDTWDDHYPTQPSNGTETLLSLIEANPQLSDFVRVAKATHRYNNMHVTPVTFADLLASDQALTVWAPQNGTFNVDSLLDLCKTTKGDSLVGQQFIANHIAHNIYNMSGDNNTSVKMLNDKMMQLQPMKFHHSNLVSGLYNQPATNGLLHVIDSNAPFAYNIYEGLTCMSEFTHIGDFLLGFEEQELDEDRSIVAGIEDGEKIYSDSVMIRKNILFNSLGRINNEDSTYAILVPTQEMWQDAVSEAKQYFNFEHLSKADSIQNYWTNISILQNLIYNMNRQMSKQDSLISVGYRECFLNVEKNWGKTTAWPYQVYYNPFDEDGILAPSNVASIAEGSNGSFYRLAKWPFTRENLYYQYVKSEAEREASITEYTQCNMNYRYAFADSISGGYLDIVPKNSTSNWKIEFEVRNTLSATYDVCAVILPKQVYNEFSKDRKPNQFKATITYLDRNGREQSFKVNEKMQNDPYHVDTVTIARVTLPVCSYAQTTPVLKVQLECSMTSKEAATFSREMYLDCIYLRPVSDDESTNDELNSDDEEAPNSIIARKEDNK